MATRLRKTRRLRGGRHMGWGQVGQHRASGHKGGLGVTGMMKHHYSSMLKYDPDHYGHDSTKPPHPNITKKWTSIRDLDDLFAKFGKVKQKREDENKRQLTCPVQDTRNSSAAAVLPPQHTLLLCPAGTASAQEKLEAVGSQVVRSNG